MVKVYIHKYQTWILARATFHSEKIIKKLFEQKNPSTHNHLGKCLLRVCPRVELT